MKLAQRVSAIKPSSTLAITSLAKSLKAKGRDIIGFAAGEPDFDTPEPIKQAAFKAIKDGFTKYTPSSGTAELRKEIAGKFLNENGISYEPAQIIVSCGAKHSLYNIFQAICEKGDEALIIAPYWLSYPEMVKLAEATPKIIETKEEDGFKVDIKTIRKCVTSKTKAIIINSPSNPAGIVYDKRELENIADIVVSKKIIAISDEIYEKLIYDGKAHYSIAALGEDIKDLTVTVNGVSKTYAMTGWRIGYLGAPIEIAKAIDELQSHSTSNPASISQAAALEALKLNKNVIEDMRRAFEKRRDYMLSLLDKIGKISYTKPEGAFYVYCNISRTGMKAGEFAKKILEEKGVAVIPCEDFGSDKHIRLSFAASDENIRKGAERIGEWLRQ